VPGAIDWFGTLSRCPHPGPSDVRRRLRLKPAARLLILALDCSSSMLPSGALAIAKGVAAALAATAARDGGHVALVSFRAGAAHARFGAGSQALQVAIAQLGAGGGTPLRRALLEAIAVGARRDYRGDDVEKRLLLLTDGRTREAVTDLRARCRSLEPCVVDCERGALRLGRARALATALGASYVHVDTLA